MRKLFADILQEVSKAPTASEKVAILQADNSLMLRQLLLAAFDPTIRFDVEIPPYRENEETDGYSSNNLFVEHRRLYIFMDEFKQVSPERKKALLVQILESIDKPDAVALIDVLNKDLEKYGLTKEIVNEAFPGLVK